MSDTPFELSSTRVADALVVTIVGEIDMSTAPEVGRAIDDADQDRAARVVIDLSEVTFLDSSALNVFVHCQRDLAAKEIELRIVSPSDRVVRNVFEITQLTGPLSVVESLDDALAK
jgi:anti-anti-sigma factor